MLCSYVCAQRERERERISREFRVNRWRIGDAAGNSQRMAFIAYPTASLMFMFLFFIIVEKDITSIITLFPNRRLEKPISTISSH